MQSVFKRFINHIVYEKQIHLLLITLAVSLLSILIANLFDKPFYSTVPVLSFLLQFLLSFAVVRLGNNNFVVLSILTLLLSKLYFLFTYSDGQIVLAPVNDQTMFVTNLIVTNMLLFGSLFAYSVFRSISVATEVLAILVLFMYIVFAFMFGSFIGHAEAFLSLPANQQQVAFIQSSVFEGSGYKPTIKDISLVVTIGWTTLLFVSVFIKVVVVTWLDNFYDNITGLLYLKKIRSSKFITLIFIPLFLLSALLPFVIDGAAVLAIQEYALPISYVFGISIAISGISLVHYYLINKSYSIPVLVVMYFCLFSPLSIYLVHALIVLGVIDCFLDLRSRLNINLNTEKNGEKEMKVIIQETTHLGKVGDIVTVKAGYARNYLLPKSIASE